MAPSRKRRPVQNTYRGLTRQQRMRERRNRWIAAATALFAVHGFRNTWLEHISAHAQTSLRSFYDLFSSKEDLLAAVVERCLADPIDKIRQTLAWVEDDPSAQVAMAVAEYIRHVTSNRGIYRILYLEAVHIQPEHVRPDPLVAVLSHTLSGRFAGMATQDLQLLWAALGGVVQFLLHAWNESGSDDADGTGSAQDLIDDVIGFCAPLLPRLDTGAPAPADRWAGLRSRSGVVPTADPEHDTVTPDDDSTRAEWGRAPSESPRG
ncbi:TetR/AcrR family transcriptional regulator [Nonomuraea sp. KM90]|uniref:TetR/AcrR family transcriptional regulator n=1 Tax=Nonomuraea sp. KM90 TaxID=3457428 RepID=UPI003FCDEBEC